MGLFDLFSGKRAATKKPNRYIEINPGPLKVPVHDTNDTQALLAEQRSHIMDGTSGLAIALCERTPEQVAEGYPDDHCLNVCTKGSKQKTSKNYLGYIDVDRAKVGYLKQYVKDYQLVEAHSSMSYNGEKYRLNVLFQPPENRKKKAKK